MNTHYLQTKFKKTSTTYLFFFLLGMHYGYLGKWGWQLLFWFTLGGLGLWGFIDLFHIPSKVSKHNLKIAMQIENLEK